MQAPTAVETGWDTVDYMYNALCTFEPLYVAHSGAELTGRGKEVSIRGKCKDRRSVGTKQPVRCVEVTVVGSCGLQVLSTACQMN